MSILAHRVGRYGILGPCADDCEPCSYLPLRKRSTLASWAAIGRCFLCGRPTTDADIARGGPDRRGRYARTHATCPKGDA